MNRHRQLEKLSQKVRAGIPSVAVPWLAAVRRPLERLTTAALDPDISDEQFREMVGEFSAALPGLYDALDHDALAGLLEGGMGAAMANGLTARLDPARHARSPWSAATYLAGRGKGRGKRCGNSWIPRWKQCGSDDGREWEEADAEEAAALSRLTGMPFREGARILATAQDIVHAERGHKHQVSENDWKNLRGRMFDPATGRMVSSDPRKDPRRTPKTIQFDFMRGKDPMRAVFTAHFPYLKSPGELRLKTFKMLDPRDLSGEKS